MEDDNNKKSYIKACFWLGVGLVSMAIWYGILGMIMQLGIIWRQY